MQKLRKWDREVRGYLHCGGPQKGPPAFHHLPIYAGVLASVPFLTSYSRSPPDILRIFTGGGNRMLIPGPSQLNTSICTGKGQSALAKSILADGSRQGPLEQFHVCWKRWRCKGYRGVPKPGRGWGKSLSGAALLPFPLRFRLGPQCQRQPRGGSGALCLWPGERVGCA